MTKDFEKLKAEKILKEFKEETRAKTADLALSILVGMSKIGMELSQETNAPKNQEVLCDYLRVVMNQFFIIITNNLFINQLLTSRPSDELFDEIITNICNMIFSSISDSIMVVRQECFKDKEKLIDLLIKRNLEENENENVTKH